MRDLFPKMWRRRTNEQNVKSVGEYPQVDQLMTQPSATLPLASKLLYSHASLP